MTDFDALALPPATQGKYACAELLYERCQAIEEKVLGLEHPRLAVTLHSRARLYHVQVRCDLDAWLLCVDMSTALCG